MPLVGIGEKTYSNEVLLACKKGCTAVSVNKVRAALSH